MAAGDAVIQNLADALTSFTKAHREQTESMKEMFSEKRAFGFFGPEEKDLVRRRQLRKQEVEKAKQGMRAVSSAIGAVESWTEAMKQNEKDASKHMAAMGNAIESMLSNTKALTGEQSTVLAGMLNQINNDVIPDIEKLRVIFESVGKEQYEYLNKQEKLSQATDKAANDLLNLSNNIQQSIKGFFTFTNMIALASKGIKKGFGLIETSLKNQVPLMDSLGGIGDMAARYRVTTSALMKVQNNYTQALVASTSGIDGLRGSARQNLAEFEKLRQKLYDVTGSYDEALELYGASREMLSFAGVKLSTDEFVKEMNKPNGLISSMKLLAATTNRSVEEIAKFNIQMMKDKDMRFIMLGLDRKQRTNRLNDILQYQQLLVNKGMEIDQAQEAAMALEKLNKQISPKERLKQAARIRGIAGAMGIAGGDRMMALAMKPKNQWTKDDYSFSNSFATSMQKGMGGLYGGGIQSQMVGGAFMEKMEGPLYNAMIEAQNTAGLDGREVSAKLTDVIKQQNNQLSGAQEALKYTKQTAEYIAAFGDDSGVYLAGAAAAGIGALVKGQLLTNTLLGTIAASSVGGGAGNLIGKVSGMSGISGIAAKTGMVGTALAAGYGIGTLINKAPEWMGFDSISTNIVDGIENMKEMWKKTEKVVEVAKDPTPFTVIAETMNNNSKIMERNMKSQYDLATALKQNTESNNKNTEVTDKSSQLGPSNRRAQLN